MVLDQTSDGVAYTDQSDIGDSSPAPKEGAETEPPASAPSVAEVDGATVDAEADAEEVGHLVHRSQP